MNKKDLLTEVMGVPKAVDFWVDYFSLMLTQMAKKIVDADEIEEAEADFEDPETKEEVSDSAYRGKETISGKDFTNWIISQGNSNLKGLLNNPNFQKLPIYQPNIDLTIIFYPNRVWKYEFTNKLDSIVDASFIWSPDTIKLATLGNNKVLVGQDFTFTVHAPKAWIDENSFDEIFFRKAVKASISHELTHAYELYNKYKTTGDPYYGRGTLLNAATSLMKDDKFPQWKEFLHLVYLHLSHEVNARVTQLYYDMKNKDVSTREEFMEALKKSNVWHEIQLLKNFDAQNFINSFTYKNSDGLEGILYDLGRNIERSGQGLKPIKAIKDPHEGMKHLIDGWNHTLQVLNKKLPRKGLYKGKLMDMVPEQALKDPKVFFKFFEKRFHKKAEILKRKVLRLASLILDEKQNEKSNS